MSSFAASVGTNVLSSCVFVALVVIFAWSMKLSRRNVLLEALGAEGAAARVEIVLSNLWLDGKAHVPLATEDTARGYCGSGVAQLEYEAAVELREALTSVWIPSFPHGRWSALLRLYRPQVLIRPCSPELGLEAQRGFVADDTHRDETKAIVLIGSPIYNRAVHDVLGGTQDVDFERCPEGAVGPSTDPAANDAVKHLRSLSLFKWVRDHAGLTGDPDHDNRLSYPKGVRGFYVTQRVPFKKEGGVPPGRTQNSNADFEQSIVQRLHVDANAPTALVGKTITTFAGVGGYGTAAAVAEFLSGEWHWSDGRKRHGGTKAWPKACGGWFSRLETQIPAERLDFASVEPVPGKLIVHVCTG
jgi:hypothetical protein